MTSSEKMMKKNHEFTEMMWSIAELDYSNEYTRYHMAWFFSLQMVSVMFFNDMKEKRWFPFKTRRQIKKVLKQKNPELWKMINALNIYHWTFVGFIAVLAAPFWRLSQVIVKKVRP
jgi:hypothetical protein